ncbi:hypothetical protein L1887_59429 [Cichorium endivia]|nr:hypothetical protein L1887_59429 [Cichorium endivia]
MKSITIPSKSWAFTSRSKGTVRDSLVNRLQQVLFFPRTDDSLFSTANSYWRIPSPRGLPVASVVESRAKGSRRTGFRPNRARSQRADGEYAAEQPQGLPAVIAELTRWAAQNLELTLKSEINVGPRLSEEGRLKRRSRKCNTTRGEPKACAKEEANQSEWRQGRRGNIMEMYRTANPGMTVRPRPWPRGVVSSTET